MAVLDKSRFEPGLLRANEIRLEAARQRHALGHAPAHMLIPALIDPTPELGTYPLRTLFAPATRPSNRPLIRHIGIHALRSALLELRNRWGYELTPEDRLDALTRDQRVHLVRALVRRAPQAWREAQSAHA